MAGEQIDHGRDDGAIFGRSGGKLGFYGLATPIVRPVITVVGTTTATTALNETRIARLTAALENLGLIETAT
jgi:hypothetical protein